VTTSGIAILGSARSDGNTRRLLDLVLGGRPVEVVDLARLDVGYYDYQHRNAADDFARVAPKLVAADAIVFATPVYWYAMSAQLKTFVDRLSDLLQTRKELGRALAGRTGWLVASSTDPELPAGFEVPFEATCGYFGMRWGGSFHGRVAKGGVLHPDVERAARAFGDGIFGDGAPA
jgi:hypothetical protein